MLAANKSLDCGLGAEFLQRSEVAGDKSCNPSSLLSRCGNTA